MKVLFFARLAEITGINEKEYSGLNSLEELRNAIEREYPDIIRHQYVCSVNRSIVHDNRQLSPSDEIALLPPFSGG